MKDNALYLEADEDITSAIDKLRKSTGGSVQIVVPKRSTLLQSIINLRLLKKAADTQGKELILVTNDRVSSELAGRVGLSVAAAVNARPVIRTAAPETAPEPEEDVIEESDGAPEMPPDRLDKKAAKKAAAAAMAAAAATAREEATAREQKLAGQAEQAATAGQAAAAGAEKSRGPFTRRELGSAAAGAAAGRQMSDADDAAEPSPGLTDRFGDGDGDGGRAAKPAKAPRIPNYGLLPKIALFGTLAVVLIAGYFIGMYFYASGKVTLYAAASKVSVNSDFSVNPTLAASDIAKASLAGKSVVEEGRKLTATATATGKKDVGTKAGGTITIKNCEDSNSHTLKAGSTFSSQGKNFISDAEVAVGPASFSNGGKTCAAGTGTVHVTAAENGDTYNLTAATFTNSLLTANYTLSGSMSGGTSKVVTVLTQGDVDSARDAATVKDKDSALDRLKAKLAAGQRFLDSSINQTVGATTATPAVGEEAASAALSISISYSALSISSADFSAMLIALEQKQVGAENQIYENGVASAKIAAVGAGGTATGGTGGGAGDTQKFKVTTDAYGGAKIDAAKVAKDLAGLKYGDAVNKAAALPGISKVEIVLMPMWSTNLPARTEQIKVDIKVSGLGGK